MLFGNFPAWIVLNYPYRNLAIPIACMIYDDPHILNQTIEMIIMIRTGDKKLHISYLNSLTIISTVSWTANIACCRAKSPHIIRITTAFSITAPLFTTRVAIKAIAKNLDASRSLSSNWRRWWSRWNKRLKFIYV